ncbi:MAG: GNAT family N-acetyltransferase [Rhizobiales bacterium]|nr:GNAT family N-acetyltransferase [Hyphomicrobiales bacterium]
MRATQPDGIVRTRRLILRPVEIGDAPAIAAGLGDFEVTRWLARVPYPYTIEEAVRFLAWEQSQRDGGEDRVFGIDLDGFIGLVSLRGRGAMPVLGYWLSRDHWGRGLMSEAVAAVVAAAFADGTTETLRSGVFEGNERSLAIQRKLGFEIIGRSRQHNLALRRDLDHIDTELTRRRHAEFTS